jgi:hypothetical protein
MILRKEEGSIFLVNIFKVIELFIRAILLNKLYINIS